MHTSTQRVTNFFEYHPKYKKVDKLITVFRCKKHGRINIKKDKLINIGGIKFCPICTKEMFEQFGICQLKRSRESSKNGKRNS